jgi:hypothetical protein
MSAFEGTWLDIALRDCGINSFVVVGVATEVGIEPTVRHGADLGYIPIVVTDACGAGNNEAAARSLEGLKFSGDAILTDAEVICATLRRLVHGNPSSQPHLDRLPHVAVVPSDGAVEFSSTARSHPSLGQQRVCCVNSSA